MTIKEAFAVVADIKCKRFVIDVSHSLTYSSLELRIWHRVPCVSTGELIKVRSGEDIPLEALYRMTIEQFLNLVRKKLHETEAHEVDEFFIYKGERVFDPHKSDPDYVRDDQVATYPKYANDNIESYPIRRPLKNYV